MNLPDPAPVLDQIDAFRRSKTMFAAVQFGVFDRLHGAAATAPALAADLGVNPGALERLLDGCAALGLLSKTDGVYRNEPVAETYLCTASENSLHGYVRYSNDALYPMWGQLESAVREGTPRWQQIFGIEGDIFSGFFRTEEAMRDFLLGMHGFGMLSSPAVIGAFDLSRFRRITDLGGATGHLAIAACERYPEMTGVVFDLPKVAAMAQEQVARSAARNRIWVVAGDFFRDTLPEADLFAAGRILHDWPDEKIDRLLRLVHQTLPVGGALLIAERLLNDSGVGPVAANMQSLNMLVATEGRERSLSEYRQLLESVGFSSVTGVPTGAPLDAILAVKVE